MVVSHIVTHAIVFALVANGLLFLMMVGTSPRVWAYNDYPKELKRQVPPQSKAERRLGRLAFAVKRHAPPCGAARGSMAHPHASLAGALHLVTQGQAWR